MELILIEKKDACKSHIFRYYFLAMAQDHLVKLVSVGDEKGAGKGHTYYTRRNRKSVENKHEFKKYNPLIRKHTVYKEKKA